MMNKKGIGGTLIIALFLFGVAGGVYYYLYEKNIVQFAKGGQQDYSYGEGDCGGRCIPKSDPDYKDACALNLAVIIETQGPNWCGQRPADKDDRILKNKICGGKTSPCVNDPTCQWLPWKNDDKNCLKIPETAD